MRREVAGGYKIVGNEVGFWLGEYDRNETLVIDPIIVYATYQGGAGADFGESVAVDSQGNAYLTGYTNGSFPVVNSTQNQAGNYDVFVSKLNALGTDFLYTTYLGGGENDYGQEIAVDNQGNAYITGNTGSNNFPTSNARQQNNNGDNDAFVTKLNSAGNQLVFSTYHGGNGYDYASGIALDNAGNIYISGGTSSTSLFPLQIARQSSNNGSFDAFVSKFNNSGSELLYSTYHDGSGYDTSFDIAVNIETGSAYITGYTQSPTSGAGAIPFQTTTTAFLSGTKDAFVSELYPVENTIQLRNSRYFGASGEDQGNSIAMCGSAQYPAQVCITGTTNSPNYFSLPGASQAIFGGQTDAFIAKFQDGRSSSVTYLGGSGADAGNAIATDTAGNVYVTGITNSANFPQVNSIQSTFGGGSDTFIVKTFFPTYYYSNATLGAFSVYNRLLFSSYYGGTGNEEGRGIGLDSNGSVYVVGTTMSSNFATVNASQTAFGGNSDAYVLKTTSISLPPYYRISGRILDANGQGIQGIYLKTVGEENLQTVSVANGNYYFDLLQNKNYSVNLRRQYTSHTLSPVSGYIFQPLTSNQINQDLTLTVNNDSFANATEITGNEGGTYTSNIAATREAGEPNHGEKTVWYKWRATSNGRITFRLNERIGKLTVYTGTNFGNLTSVGTRAPGMSGSVTVQTTAGTEYKIVISGEIEEQSLSWSEYILIYGGVSAPYNVRPITVSVSGPVSPSFPGGVTFNSLPPPLGGGIQSHVSYVIPVTSGFDRTVSVYGGYAPGCPVWSPQSYNFPNLTTDTEVGSFAGIHNTGCLNFTTTVRTGLFATNSSIAPIINFIHNLSIYNIAAQASGGTGEYIATSPALPSSPIVESISHPNYAFTQLNSNSTSQTATTYQFSARLKDSCTYQFNPSSLPITANGGTGTIAITPTGNNCLRLITNSSWITASITGNAINYTIVPNTVSTSRTGYIKIGETSSLTVTQAGSPSRFSIDDYLFDEGNSGNTAFTFTIRRIGNISEAASVNYSSADGTAVSGQDYQAIANQTINFTAEEAVKTVTVQVNGDVTFEPNESFTVNLSNPSGGALIERGTALGGIVNDDAYTQNPLPTISSLSRTTATIGDAGFTLSVNGGGFISSSEVKWGNTVLSNRTLVSTTQIDVPIPAALLQTVGTFPITVSNPESGGGTSTAVNFTVNPCQYAISPPNTPQPIAAAGGNGSFNMTTTAGCAWTATPSDSWITISSPINGNGSGNSAITFNVSANTGAARSGTISVGGQTFTMNQESGCTYQLNPTSIDIPAASGGITYNFNVLTGTGCLWNATVTNGSSWITNVVSNAGNGTVTFQATANTGAVRQGTINVDNQTFTINQQAAAVNPHPPMFDFDGDRKADISVFRPSGGAWYINGSLNGFVGITWGFPTDIPVPADYDGDGKTDFAIFRPSDGGWYRLNSSDGTYIGLQWGISTDIPRPGDFDGDGKADVNVFRPSDGGWYRLNSSTNEFIGLNFGQNGDQPLIANFDGDGKSDVSVFRPSTASFYWLDSSTGNFKGVAFGLASDIPTPGDFDGDGKTDVAVFRPSNGAWYRLNSSNNSFYGVAFGQNGDNPVAADYDGDGKTDIAVFRNGNWYYLKSLNGEFVGLTFGFGTDKPLPSAFTF